MSEKCFSRSSKQAWSSLSIYNTQLLRKRSENFSTGKRRMHKPEEPLPFPFHVRIFVIIPFSLSLRLLFFFFLLGFSLYTDCWYLSLVPPRLYFAQLELRAFIFSIEIFFFLCSVFFCCCCVWEIYTKGEIFGLMMEAGKLFLALNHTYLLLFPLSDALFPLSSSSLFFYPPSLSIVSPWAKGKYFHGILCLCIYIYLLRWRKKSIFHHI
jgi:hypothetical protein